MSELTLVVLSVWAAFAAGLNCNGNPNYCSLRFDQITLVGSHGSGAGFNGPVRQCDGTFERYCIFDNQNLTITQQLQLGVRFLNLDICILPNSCNDTFYGNLSTSRLVSCRGGESVVWGNRFGYGGRLIDILQQTDDWLRQNPNEVIAIHFTRQIPTNDLAMVGPMIASLLESKWGSGTANVSVNSQDLSATEMSTYYSNNGMTWPTLRTAITDNQRIFVFFDSEISTQGPKPWLHGAPSLTANPYDSTSPEVEIKCLHLQNVICSGAEEILVLAAMNFGTCLLAAQERCNVILQNETNFCFENRLASNRTVNVIMVDFVSVGPVFQVADEINRRNLLEFNGIIEEVTSLSTESGTSGMNTETTVGMNSTTSPGTSGAFTVHTVRNSLLLTILFMSLFH